MQAYFYVTINYMRTMVQALLSFFLLVKAIHGATAHFCCTQYFVLQLFETDLLAMTRFGIIVNFTTKFLVT